MAKYGINALVIGERIKQELKNKARLQFGSQSNLVATVPIYIRCTKEPL